MAMIRETKHTEIFMMDQCRFGFALVEIDGGFSSCARFFSTLDLLLLYLLRRRIVEEDEVVLTLSKHQCCALSKTLPKSVNDRNVKDSSSATLLQ